MCKRAIAQYVRRPGVQNGSAVQESGGSGEKELVSLDVLDTSKPSSQGQKWLG